jgi:hypothetical protein
MIVSLNSNNRIDLLMKTYFVSCEAEIQCLNASYVILKFVLLKINIEYHQNKHILLNFLPSLVSILIKSSSVLYDCH